MNFFSNYKLSLSALIMIMMVNISACSQTDTDNIAKAQSAYEDNKFRSARIFLLNELQENPADINANALLAQTALAMGDGDSAQAALNRLPDDFDNIRPMKAHALILKGQSSEVINLYAGIDSKDYNDQDWRMLIWAKIEAGEDKNINSDLQRALGIYRKNSQLLSLSAAHQLTQFNNRTALSSAQKAIEYDENNFEAYNIAGLAALRMNNIEEAIDIYTRADENFPDTPIPAINLADIALDKNDLETAKPYVEKAEKLSNTLPLTLYIKARYAHASGDNEIAKSILQDSKSGLDDYEPAIFLSGKVAFELGEYELAASKLRRIIANDPRNEEAAAILKQIPL